MDPEADYLDAPDTALFDGATTLAGSSDGDTLTTFGEILRHERVDTPTVAGTDQSTSEGANAVLQSAQTFCVQAKGNIGECMVDTKDDITGYVTTSAKQVKECVEDIFSEEKLKSRAEAATKIASDVKSYITSCHDKIDSILVHFFDHPLSEVEIRPDNLQPNESITIDPMTDGDSTLASSVPSKRRLSRRSRSKRAAEPEYGDVFLAPTEEEPFSEEEPFTSRSETDWEGRDEGDHAGTSESAMNYSDTQTEDFFPTIRSTDSDNSVLRFKEALYRHLGDNSEQTSPPNGRYKHEGSDKESPTSVLDDLDASSRFKTLVAQQDLIDLSNGHIDEPVDTNYFPAYPARPALDPSDADIEYHLSSCATRKIQNHRDDVDSQATMSVSGSKPAEPDNDVRHIDLSFASPSMPSFPEEQETIDCSWIEDRDDDEGIPIGYDEQFDGFVQPIDLTMYS